MPAFKRMRAGVMDPGPGWDTAQLTIDLGAPRAAKVVIMAAFFAEGWVPIGWLRCRSMMQLQFYGKRRRRRIGQ